MGPEAMLICDIANLPEHSGLVLVAVASLHLHWRVALLLFPLLVALVINHLVAILVRVEFMVLVVLMVLLDDTIQASALIFMRKIFIGVWYDTRLLEMKVRYLIGSWW